MDFCEFQASQGETISQEKETGLHALTALGPNSILYSQSVVQWSHCALDFMVQHGQCLASEALYPNQDPFPSLVFSCFCFGDSMSLTQFP